MPFFRSTAYRSGVSVSVRAKKPSSERGSGDRAKENRSASSLVQRKKMFVHSFHRALYVSYSVTLSSLFTSDNLGIMKTVRTKRVLFGVTPPLHEGFEDARGAARTWKLVPDMCVSGGIDADREVVPIEESDSEEPRFDRWAEVDHMDLDRVERELRS